MLEAGSKAPEFTLQDKDGNNVSSQDMKGKKYVVYFYPKDNTPGCTKQACGFRDAIEEYNVLDIPVIGISKDSVRSHSNFAAKHELPFILLSDPDLIAIKGFDAWQLKKLYGKEYYGIVRCAFLVNEEGVIEKAYHKVKPDQNAREILNYLQGKEQ